MSRLLAELIAQAISDDAGLSSSQKLLREKLLGDGGAVFDRNNQCWVKGTKRLSVEMALFSPVDALARFLDDEER